MKRFRTLLFWTHLIAGVSAAVGALGLALIVLGAVALARPALALVLGLAATGGFLLWLRGRASAL